MQLVKGYKLASSSWQNIRALVCCSNSKEFLGELEPARHLQVILRHWRGVLPIWRTGLASYHCAVIFSYLNIIFLWLFRSPLFTGMLDEIWLMDLRWIHGGSISTFFLCSKIVLMICLYRHMQAGTFVECIKYKRQLSAQERVNPRLSSINMINAYQTAF